MPPKNHDSDSIHEPRSSDSHLWRESDHKLAERIAAIEATQLRQEKSASRQLRVSVGQLTTLVVALFGGGLWMTDFRTTFQSKADALTKQVESGLTSMNSKLEKVQADTQQLNVTAAVLQQNIQPIEQFRERLRVLEMTNTRLEADLEILKKRM